MVMTVFNNTGPQNSSKTHINITSIQLQAQEKRIVQPLYRQIKNQKLLQQKQSDAELFMQTLPPPVSIQNNHRLQHLYKKILTS